MEYYKIPPVSSKFWQSILEPNIYFMQYHIIEFYRIRN